MQAWIHRELTTNKWVYLSGFVFLILELFLITQGDYWFTGLPLLGFTIFLAARKLNLFILLIVFLTPLSVPSEFYYPDLGFNLQLVTEPMLILVMVLVGYRYLLERKFDSRILVHPISWIIYIQVFWIFTTSITSSMPWVSFKFLTSRLWFLTTFYFMAAAMFQKKQMMRTYLWCFTIAMLVVVVYALINQANHGLFSQQFAYLSPLPFFRDHTSYGAILAMLIPVVGSLGAMPGNASGKKFLIWTIFVFLCIAIVFSYTRASWISLFLAFLLFLIVKLRISFKWVGLFVLTLLLILFSFRTEIFLKLEQNRQDSSRDLTKHLQSITNIRTDASNLERINRWNSAFRMYHEQPFTGWGPGTYMFQYAPFQASDEKSIISTNNGDWGNAHSEFIGPLAESGWPGMIIMMLLVLASQILGWKVYFRSKPHSSSRVLSLGLTLGLITYFIHGMLNNFLDTDKASALVWGYLAMLVMLDLKLKNKESKDEIVSESDDQIADD